MLQAIVSILLYPKCTEISKPYDESYFVNEARFSTGDQGIKLPEAKGYVMYSDIIVVLRTFCKNGFPSLRNSFISLKTVRHAEHDQHCR